jgi:hypothetical protein
MRYDDTRQRQGGTVDGNGGGGREIDRREMVDEVKRRFKLRPPLIAMTLPLDVPVAFGLCILKVRVAVWPKVHLNDIGSANFNRRKTKLGNS